MSGKKGHSGRRPFVSRNEREAIVHKAWNKINYKLGMSDPQSFNIASSIVVKDMTEKSQVDMSATITQEEKNILSKYISPNRIALIDKQ